MTILFNNNIYAVCKIENGFLMEYSEPMGWYKNKKRAENFAEFCNFCIPHVKNNPYIVRTITVK